MKNQFRSTIGRGLAASLSRSSNQTPTDSFASQPRRLAGTCRYVAKGTGSHSLDDNSIRFGCFDAPTNPSLALHVVYSRAFHASPARNQSSDDFAIRAQQFGLASREEVALAAEDPSTVFLDVRSPPEIEDASLASRPCVKIWCTMDDTSMLLEEAGKLIPDKDATIVIFCAVGGRASVAKRCLEEMGYKNVLNAGGLCDLDSIQ